MASVNQQRIDLLRNLLGTADVNPKVAAMFQTATPASYGPLNATYFTPYQMAVSGAGDWQAQPVGSLQKLMSLKNYIQEVNKALMMPTTLEGK